jgi:hypothetical protein
MRGQAGLASALVLGLLAAAGPRAAAQTADALAADERVVLFPTCAVPSDDASGWSVPVHGWVYEPEHDSLARALALRAFAEALDLPADDAAGSARFRERAWPFLVDNERGKAPTPCSSGGRSAVQAMRGPASWCASITAGCRLAVAVPLVVRTGPGRPVDRAIPRATKDADRSSRQMSVWTPSLCNSATAMGVERDPGQMTA